MISRKERPHLGAQLLFTDADGLRLTHLVSRRPRVSVTICRLRPMILLAGSTTWLVRGTVAEVLMLWLSIRQVVGWLARPSARRTSPHEHPTATTTNPAVGSPPDG